MTPAAFFDLDGTLFPSPSLERRFACFLLQRGELGFAQGIRWLTRALPELSRDRRAATAGNKAYLAGVPAIAAEEWATTLQRSPLQFFQEALHRLEWHAVQGHRIFLISGTLAPLAKLAAARLPVRAEVHATELGSLLNCWTGRIVGEWLSGEAKAQMVVRLANENGLDLARSSAYGDCAADLPMLCAVGHPVAVNPSPRLERLARQRGWPVLEWHPTQAANGPSVRELLFPITLDAVLRWR